MTICPRCGRGNKSMNKTEIWLKGFRSGEKTVFEFLEEVEKIPWSEELKRKYNAWCNSDEDVLSLEDGKK